MEGGRKKGGRKRTDGLRTAKVRGARREVREQEEMSALYVEEYEKLEEI